MKKILTGILALAMVLSLAACGSSPAPAASDTGTDTPADSAPAAADAEAYPAKNIQGTIMWSAGGVCDIVSRAIGLLAQEELGQTIVFTNRAGSGGGSGPCPCPRCSRRGDRLRRRSGRRRL